MSSALEKFEKGLASPEERAKEEGLPPGSGSSAYTPEGEAAVEAAATAAGGSSRRGGGGGGGGGVNYPPGPTCPEGESLYKVPTSEGVKYVYAASSDVAKDLVPGAWWATRVMSPAAYEGGVYPNEREVTTVGGQQVMVPYSPEKEAKSEFSKLYGFYPQGGSLAEGGWISFKGPSSPGTTKPSTEQVKALETLYGEIGAGIYTSPLVNNTVIQGLANQWGLTYAQALMETKQIANRALCAMVTPSSCGSPLGMTYDEASIAADYLESIGRTDEADRIRSYFVSIGHPENQIERAEKIGYGLYDDLADYRTGDSYNLTSAVAHKVVSDKDKPELLAMGFSVEAVDNAFATGGAILALQLGGYVDKEGNTTPSKLGTAISAGVVTDAVVRQLYGDEIIDAAETSGAVGAEVPSKKGFWGRAWEWFTKPTGYMPPPEIPAFGKTAQEAVFKWSEEAKKGSPTISPMDVALGFGGLVTVPLSVGAMGTTKIFGSLGQLFRWSRVPVQLGYTSPLGEMAPGLTRMGLQVLSKGLTFGKQLIPPTIVTTGIGLFGGLGYKPEPIASRTEQVYGSLSSETKQAIKVDYLRDAGEEYDRVKADLGPGETMSMSKEEFLSQAESEFDSRLRETISEQIAGRMEYQPGIKGYIGRAGEVLKQPVYAIEKLPGPQLPKSLLTGIYQLYAPLTVATELFPTKGPKAFTTMIPYFGPVTAGGIMQWKEGGLLGQIGTVAFTALPFASGALSYLRAPKISSSIIQLRKLGIGPKFGLPTVEYTAYQQMAPLGLLGSRLTPQVTGKALELRGGGTFGGGTIGLARFITETIRPKIIESLPKELVSKIKRGEVLTPQEEVLALRYVVGKISSGAKLSTLELQIQANNPQGVEVFLQALQGRPTGITRMVGGVTAKQLTMEELVSRGTTVELNLASRLKEMLYGKGGITRPESELHPFRQALGYYGEIQYPREGPLPSGMPKKPVGFLQGGQLLSELPYEIARYSFPLEGPTAYVGGTVPQWLARWAEFGGLPQGLWGPKGIWSKGGWLWGGGGIGRVLGGTPWGGRGSIATQTGTQTGTVTGTITGMQTTGIEAPVGGQPVLSYQPILGFSPRVSPIGVVEPLRIPLTALSIPLMTPVITPVATPVITPVLTPVTTPVTYPAPSTVFAPAPAITTPVPTPTPTPVPPKPKIKTPFPWWKFGLGGLGGGTVGGRVGGKLLGVGTWKFTGFKVSGPHPLKADITGYTWMGGREMPYGVGKKVPRVQGSKTPTIGGLVRMNS